MPDFGRNHRTGVAPERVGNAVLVLASPDGVHIWGRSGDSGEATAAVAIDSAPGAYIAYLERWLPGAPTAAIDVMVGAPAVVQGLRRSVGALGLSAPGQLLRSVFVECGHAAPAIHYVDPWQSATSLARCPVQRLPSRRAHQISALAQRLLSACEEGDRAAARGYWDEVENSLAELGALENGAPRNPPTASAADEDEDDAGHGQRMLTGDPAVDEILNLLSLDALNRLSLAGQARTESTRDLVLSGLGPGSRHLLADVGAIAAVDDPTPRLTALGERVLGGAVLITETSPETREATSAAIGYLADLDHRLGVKR